jgi:hypothetical protein
VFERVGCFATTWGAVADFEWGFRASLLHNVIYLPEPLVSFRIHSDQASAKVDWRSDAHRKLPLKMIDRAMEAIGAERSVALHRLSARLLKTPLETAHFIDDWHRSSSPWNRALVLTRYVVRRPEIVIRFLLRRIFHRGEPVFDGWNWVRTEFRRITGREWYLLVS